MADYNLIYRTQAELYDRMVSAEDVDRAVLGALTSLLELRGAVVVEVGVGTGRITRQLVDAGAIVTGVEPEKAMLDVARGHLRRMGADPKKLVKGSLDALPFSSASADLGVAGWVFGHQRTFEPEQWRATVARGIGELERVVRPGGVIAVFETLGTAVDEPGVKPDLAELQTYLEEGFSFERSVLRTDYQFSSSDEAAAALEFFFGKAVADRIRARSWARVPEWTGCWSKRR